MNNPRDVFNAAAGAEALPLQLLQPLDSSNPSSTPVPLGGPEQRLAVTPDPGVDGHDGSWLPPSQLLITKDGQTRSIWPVHLAGWQALGWQLLSPASGGDDSAPVDAEDNAPEPAVDPGPVLPEQEGPEPEPELDEEPEPDLEPDPQAELPERSPEPNPAPAPAPAAAAAADGEASSGSSSGSGGEALLAAEPTDFQAMTKAQIVEFCSSLYGVELDGSQTKAELVEQATALEAQASGTAAADLAALELGDALL
jgi:hypothetical protein